MRAIRFHAAGEPADVLKLESMESPEPQKGEVLVRMLAAPVNPSDLMFIRGRYTSVARCPATPGFEGVGIVEGHGGSLRGKLFQGRRVAVLNRAGGNWAEYAIVPESQVIPLSSSLSNEQAATFFVNPATAWVMTQEVLRIPKGGWLLQSAAGSALGRMIIRLARHCGFRTINLVRRPEVAEELRRLGADHVEVCDDRTSAERLQAAINAVTGGQGIRYAIDATGGSVGSAMISLLGPGGRMLAYGTLSNQPLVFSPRTLMTVGSCVEGFWLGNFMAGRGLIYKLRLVNRLTQLIRNGTLASEIRQTLPLDQFALAVRSAEDSSVTGKTLLTMS
jgi:NADPH:quinone reductase